MVKEISLQSLSLSKSRDLSGVLAVWEEAEPMDFLKIIIASQKVRIIFFKR